MTDIEKKALTLVREVLTERGISAETVVSREVSSYTEALCRAIEQHEAFRQEVSDAVVEYFDPEPWNCERAKRTFSRFIIAKPDPLVEVLDTLGWSFDDTGPDRADDLRAALAARGLEVREKQA